MVRRRTYRGGRRASSPRRVAAFKSTIRRKRKVNLKLKVKKQVAGEIWGVILLMFAAVTILSIQGAFGLLGTIWVSMLKPVIGWGIYVIPVLFGISAFMMFFSRKITFGFTRIFGMFLFLVSVLGVFHMAVPIESILAYAQEGSHGGYIGFVTNFVLRQILHIGPVGTGIVFVAVFLVSLLLTFEVSLGTIMRALTPKIEIEIDDSSDRKKRGLKSSADAELDDSKTGSDETAEKGMFKKIFGREKAEEVMPELMIKRSIGVGAASAEVLKKAAETAATDEDEDEEISEVASIKKGENDPDKEAKEKIAEKLKKDNEKAAAEKAAKEKDLEELEWEYPSLDLLNSEISTVHVDDNFLKKNAENIRQKLEQFGIDVTMHEANVGPAVIQYTLKPADGIKLSRITGLKSDLALALAARSIRIEAPIPGKSLVGIEVPTEQRANVHLREILESDAFNDEDSKLRLPLGRDVSGNPIVADLDTMPHLLIAGATGSGKSVCMNAFLLALLYQNTPEELKMIMVDPKRVELSSYNHLPYLLTPVIKDPEKAALSLRWVVAEMTRRYQVLSEARVRNVKEYHALENRDEKMPKIIVVVDELADLMMAAGKEVEASICRIAQMARAVGIHLIIATQRPSVDVITGLIKANIPARIAFAVSSQIDSRTILDGGGAEDLLGRGDMLYMPSGMGKPFRVQGVYVSTQEIERVTNRIKLTSYEPDYDDAVTSTEIAQRKLNGIPDSKIGRSSAGEGGFEDAGVDESVYQAAHALVMETRKASASLLQRRLKLGYARAARIIDLLEERGVVGPANGAKPREILGE